MDVSWTIKKASVLKNGCFWTVLLEKTIESPLDRKESKPVNLIGNQSWLFIGKTDAEAETPILWPDGENWLFGKKSLMLEKIEGGRISDNRGWDSWMALPTRRTWDWASSGSWWWARKHGMLQSISFSSVQSLSRVQLFATTWIAARQASLSITNSQSSLRLMSIELVMSSSHLIFCYPLLLLSPIPPSIRVFSNESTLHMRWPKYWSFSFSIIPSKEIPGLISFRMDWISLQSKGLSRVFSNTTVQKHQFFGAQLS